MGKAGLIRVVATGRSLVSFLKDWDPDMELDYLIYSSGLALCRWTPEGPGEHIFLSAFSPFERDLALEIAAALNQGFVAFWAPPESHGFYYLDPPNGLRSPGFAARLATYSQVAIPWAAYDGHRPLSQVLVMALASDFPAIKEKVAPYANRLSITQSTSPYGDNRLWLEIFPFGITKSSAAQRLVELIGLTASQAAAVGNDFNDENLLAWAGRGFAVPGSPAELLAQFENLKGPGGVLERVFRAIS
jgi:hydroxymethylpyrimidine pyrophosphatase-like HAD family hydrolase